MFEAYKDLFSGSDFLLVMKFLYYSAFVWVPAFALYLLWDLWVRYVQAVFLSKQEHILLEIRLPKDIFKSPKAAEFFITNLRQTSGEKNWYEKYWKGGMRAWTSLELVSIDGAIHFFVWTRKGFKNQIEANLYSQYPGIEVFQVEDYTIPVVFNPDQLSLWATEFDLTKEDFYPIKTYMDYGMDKDPKEEYKIDPLTPLLEFLGGVGRGHNIWIQIIVRAHKEEQKDPVTGKMIDKRWSKAAEEAIEKIIKKAKGEEGPDKKIIPGTGRPLTDIEKETINALGRSISKPGLDVGMRAVYFAPKDIYNPSNIGGVLGGITHFNSHLNGFKPARGSEEKWKYLIWKDRSPKARNAERQSLLDAYKRRAYFHKPFKSPHFVLNTEELATIFHFPGGVSSTPTFTRIESRKAEAPANLPI